MNEQTKKAHLASRDDMISFVCELFTNPISIMENCWPTIWDLAFIKNNNGFDMLITNDYLLSLYRKYVGPTTKKMFKEKFKEKCNFIFKKVVLPNSTRKGKGCLKYFWNLDYENVKKIVGKEKIDYTDFRQYLNKKQCIVKDGEDIVECTQHMLKELTKKRRDINLSVDGSPPKNNT